MTLSRSLIRCFWRHITGSRKNELALSDLNEPWFLVARKTKKTPLRHLTIRLRQRGYGKSGVSTKLAIQCSWRPGYRQSAAFWKSLPWDSLLNLLDFLDFVQILQYIKLARKVFVLWNRKELPLLLIVSTVCQFLLKTGWPTPMCSCKLNEAPPPLLRPTPTLFDQSLRRNILH